MLFDTHAHLYDKKFNPDRELVIEQARQSGVSTILNAGSCIKSSAEVVKLAEQYNFMFAAIGIHPHNAKGIAGEQPYSQLAVWSKLPKVVAIGEIGLDYYYDFSPREIQKNVFIRQLELAKQLDSPVIIHDRDAHEDVIKIIKKEAQGVKGVFHCFSGSLQMMHEVINLGFYVSLGGAVTFLKSVKLKEIARTIPLKWLLLETDCPYLTPQPYRGKRNEPKYVRYVAEEIASLRGISWQEIAEITTENAKRLFNIQ